MRILQGDEDLRSKLTWAKNCKDMLTGLAVNDTGPAMTLLSSVMSTTCCGCLTLSIDVSAQVRKEAAIKTAVDANGENAENEAKAKTREEYWTINNVKNAILQVVRENLPCKCSQKVKRHLRRNCQKPFDMKVRIYASHLQRINREELPQIPPVSEDNLLSTDEIIDILLFGTPKAWQREMDRQGFDPFEEPLFQVHNQLHGTHRGA